MVIVGLARHLPLHLKIKHESLRLEELALHPQSFAGDFLLVERVQDAQSANQGRRQFSDGDADAHQPAPGQAWT